MNEYSEYSAPHCCCRRTAEHIYNKYKDLRTVGVVEEDAAAGLRRVAEPVGVLCGIVPTTNPTSTAIFKASRLLLQGIHCRKLTNTQRLQFVCRPCCSISLALLLWVGVCVQWRPSQPACSPVDALT